MSAKKLIGSGLLATAGTLALCGSAFAWGGQAAYAPPAYAPPAPAPTWHDYESSPNCGAACVAPAYGYEQGYAYQEGYAPSQYGYEYSYQQSAPPVYVDCTQLGTCAQTGYEGYSSYQQSSTYTGTGYAGYTGSTYATETAPCPAGTTAQPDGTCLMHGGGHLPPIVGTSGYSSSVTTGYSSSTTRIEDCPAGTVRQPDNSCLQAGVGIASSHVVDTGVATTAVPCPSNTTLSIGGCRLANEAASASQSASSVEIYSGSGASASSSASSSAGYSTGIYGATDYRPVRK